MRSAAPLQRSFAAHTARRTNAVAASLQSLLMPAVRLQSRATALRPLSASFATAASAASSAPAAATATGAAAAGSPQGSFSSIPVIDLTGTFGSTPAAEARRRAVAKEIDAAARNVGFFTIVGHGIDEAAIANVWKITQSYFDLPEAKKNEIQMDKDYPYGQLHTRTHSAVAN